MAGFFIPALTLVWLRVAKLQASAGYPIVSMIACGVTKDAFSEKAHVPAEIAPAQKS